MTIAAAFGLRWNAGGILAAALLCAGPVAAATLDITGTYGDPRGCEYAVKRDYSEQEYVLLTAEEVSTAMTLCSFVQIVPYTNGNMIVTVMCGHEGDEAQTLALMRIQKDPDGADNFRIFDADGTEWGKAERCP